MYLHPYKTEEESQAELSAEFWKKIRFFRWIFQICPHLKWLAVCNSLPMKTLKPKSDIDLFIVTESGKMFTCRLWIIFLTSIFGVRRHGKKIRKRFCLSFFVEENHDNLEKIAIEDDIYLARWVQTLEPIAGDFDGYLNFYKENKAWSSQILNFDYAPNSANFKKRNFLQKVIKFILTLPSLPFEKFLMNFQIKRALKKASKLADSSGTIINQHMLKFHDRDLRLAYRDRERNLSSSAVPKNPN